MKTITIDGIEYELVELGSRETDQVDIAEDQKKFPQVGDSYWAIEEKPMKYVYADVEFCIKNIESGNCYKTEEQAQAVYDLRCHIAKFDMPEKDESYFWMDSDIEWRDGVCFFRDLTDRADYNSGITIAKNSTKEDRAERLRLLKLAYNI